MRIFLPERLSMMLISIFAIVLAVVQLIQGTDFRFVLFTFLYIVLWAYTFNLAGGFTRTSGAYVFWYGLLTIIVGIVIKAVLGEPADSNTYEPIVLVEVYLVSMMVMVAAVQVSRRITADVVSVAGRLRASSMDYRNASLGCSVIGIVLPWVSHVLPSGSGTIFGALRQIDLFLPIGLILGTIYTVQSTKGRTSWSFLNGVPAATQFLVGFTTFSKQGLFTPILCWFIGVAYTRYKMRVTGLAGLAFTMWLVMAVLSPISQVGRNLIDPGAPFFDHFKVGVRLLIDWRQTKAEADETMHIARINSNSYYDADLGVLTRFTRIEADDALIAYSLRGHHIGYASFRYGFLNWFPHLIFPDKDRYAPTNMGGNYYGREIGAVPSDDFGTGISFGPPAEAFHFDGWTSLVLVLLCDWILLFISCDLLCGDLRRSPWGLVFAMAFSHVAPESGVSNLTQFIAFGNFGLFCCMLFCTYAAPVIGSLVTLSVTRRVPVSNTEEITMPATAGAR